MLLTTYIEVDSVDYTVTADCRWVDNGIGPYEFWGQHCCQTAWELEFDITQCTPSDNPEVPDCFYDSDDLYYQLQEKFEALMPQEQEGPGDY